MNKNEIIFNFVAKSNFVKFICYQNNNQKILIKPNFERLVITVFIFCLFFI